MDIKTSVYENIYTPPGVYGIEAQIMRAEMFNFLVKIGVVK